MKDNHYREYGQRKEQGRRTDLESIASIMAEQGMDGVKEQCPEAIIKYYKGLKALEFECYKPEIKDKEVFVYWGVTGGGKTHKVYEDNKDVYKVKYGNCGIWFDGYDFNRHRTVLFDEFVGQVKIQDMLQYLDKYPVQVEFKGGVTWFCPDKIYIVSNKHPKEWYDWSKQNEQIQQAFMRRIKGRVTEFKVPYIKEKLKWDDI